jgi:histidinol-phosphate phosphatase family protein
VNPLDQVVVPCGGRGDRLSPVIGDLPKVLVKVGERELLAHLLEDLARAGAQEVLLLAGWQGEQVAQAAERLAPRGLQVETFIEPEPRGTAGALRDVADRLAERFVVTFGDVFTCLDWKRFANAAENDGGLATLLVHRSSHPEDSDRLTLDDRDQVIAWIGRDARHPTTVVSESSLTNSAVAVFHRDILQRIPKQRPSDLFGEILPALVEAREPIFGYRSSEYVRDLGTPERLIAVSDDFERGATKLRAELVLLDRDGTLNEDVDLIHKPQQLKLIPGAAAAVEHLNRAGIKVALLTNQPVVARGLCSLDALTEIHERLSGLLKEENAFLNAIYFCPHHPETHHAEGVADLRGPCNCRKPAVGMVQQALQEQKIPAWRTVMIGDRTTDLQLAHNAGLAGIGLETGAACQDGRYSARPVWRFSNLQEAARWLCATDISS